MSVPEHPAENDPSTFRGRFAEVYDQNYDAIFRYLRRRVSSEQAADLTAETFLVALREFEKLDASRGSVRAWLFGISSNLMKREARREKQELRAYARSGIDPLIEDPMSEIDRRLDAEHRHSELAGGLATLAADDREALLLLCWGELSYPEISSALNVPLGTVKSRISRARRHLSSWLTEDEPKRHVVRCEEIFNG